MEIDAELERQSACIASAKKLVEEAESQLAFAEYAAGGREARIDRRTSQTNIVGKDMYSNTYP